MTPELVGGRYEVAEIIGRGGAASVHRAWDRDLERWVALKVLPAELGDRTVAERRSEARMLAAVNHPGLVTLFDAVTDDDNTYLVMELLDGGTLRTRMAAPGLDVTAVALQVARGLAHIHAVGIVHRDVKPANILLASASGAAPVAKLSDFGIARLVETSPSGVTGVVGTARYLSPEQASGRPAGPASDVYSLGLTLLEALTGEIAFPGGPAESLAARLVRDPVVPSALGYGWRSLLSSMLARDPASRPTADRVALQLAAFASPAADHQTATAPIALPLAERSVLTGTIGSGATGTGTAGTATTAVVPTPRTRRRRTRIAGLAIGCAIALGAGSATASLVAGAALPAASSPAAERSSAAPRAASTPSSTPSRSTASTAKTGMTEVSDVTRTGSSSTRSSGSRSTGTSTAVSNSHSTTKKAAPKGPGAAKAPAPGHAKAPSPGHAKAPGPAGGAAKAPAPGPKRP